MANANFVHLRVHTAYSLSEGAIPISELLELCRAREMPAVAITDHDTVDAIAEGTQAAAGSGVSLVPCKAPG